MPETKSSSMMQPKSCKLVPLGPGRMPGCISPGPVIGPSTVGMSGTAAWAAASSAISVKAAETRVRARATQCRIAKLTLRPPFEALMGLLQRTGRREESKKEEQETEWDAEWAN